MGDKHPFLKSRGILPAIALVLLGAMLVLVSNFLLTDKAKTAIENAQVQAQTVKESSLCEDSPEEEACKQSEKILNNPTSSVAGPQGIQGVQGSTGPQGPAGPRGSAGSPGPVGPAGPVGPQGEKGDQGIQGILGIQGVAGPVGLPGVAGATGPVGPMGPAGEPGAKGDPGPKGDTGSAGADGAYPVSVSVDCVAGIVTVDLSNGQIVSGRATCPDPIAAPAPVPDPTPTAP